MGVAITTKMEKDITLDNHHEIKDLFQLSVKLLWGGGQRSVVVSDIAECASEIRIVINGR